LTDNEDQYSCEIRVIAPFDSKDPDEYIREYGIEQYKTYIKQAPLLIDFELEQILKDYKPDLSPLDKLELIKKILPLAGEIPDKIIQNEYVKLISDRIHTDETALLREIQKHNNLNMPVNKDFLQIVTKSSKTDEKAQKNLLSLFLVCSSVSEAEYLSEIISNVKFGDEKLKIIKNAIDKNLCEVNNGAGALIDSLYTQFAEDNELKNIITDIIYTAESFKGLSEKDFKTAAEENAAKIQHAAIKSEEKEIISKYKKLKDDDAESLQSQIELLEIIKNKNKTGDKIQ